MGQSPGEQGRMSQEWGWRREAVVRGHQGDFPSEAQTGADTRCCAGWGPQWALRVTRPQGGLGGSALLNHQVTTLGDLTGWTHSYPHTPEADC